MDFADFIFNSDDQSPAEDLCMWVNNLNGSSPCGDNVSLEAKVRCASPSDSKATHMLVGFVAHGMLRALSRMPSLAVIRLKIAFTCGFRFAPCVRVRVSCSLVVPFSAWRTRFPTCKDDAPKPEKELDFPNFMDVVLQLRGAEDELTC